MESLLQSYLTLPHAHSPVAADPIHHKIPNKPLNLPLERQKSLRKEVEPEKMIPKHDV
jgi:hypothetical protein